MIRPSRLWSRIRSFLSELRRRRVYRVAVVYVAVGVAISQAADVVVPALHLPTWTLTLIVVLLLLGFPLAVVLAWAFEMTPRGIRRAPEAEERGGGAGAAAPAAGGRGDGGRAAVYVAAGLLMAGLGYGGYVLLAPSTPERAPDDEPGRPPTIAVLPFENTGGNPDAKALVDGIHDDLLTHLARIENLRVISRTSVTGYRNTTKTIPEIAAELGATVLLEGGVQLAGDEIRINAQLIHGERDEHLWARSYDRDYSVEGILALQSELAGRIAEALRLTLTPAGRRAIRERPTDDTEAYEHYLRGRGLINESAATEDVSLYPAFEKEFRRAVELDPGFGPAHAQLSATHSAFWLWAGDRSGSRLEDALREAELALELAPRHELSLVAMAFALHNAGELDRALEYAKRATRLDGESSPVFFHLGRIHADRGEYLAALRAFRRASDLDPRNLIPADFGFSVAVATRRWEEAERFLERTLRLPVAESRRIQVRVQDPIRLYLSRDADVRAAQRELHRARGAMDLPPAEVARVLSVFPSLIRGGSFDELLTAVGPDAADSTRRCGCWQARAVWHETNGRLGRARDVWGRWADRRQKERSTFHADRYEGIWRSRQAFILARAGEEEVARQEMRAAWELDVFPHYRSLMREDRYRLRATLGQVEGMLEDLEALLSRPSPVSPREVRVDPFLAPYRDDPRLQRLVDRYDSETGTTAMARTTGYTCSACVRVVARKLSDGPGVSPLEILGQDEAWFAFILGELRGRNVELSEG